MRSYFAIGGGTSNIDGITKMIPGRVEGWGF